MKLSFINTPPLIFRPGIKHLGSRNEPRNSAPESPASDYPHCPNAIQTVLADVVAADVRACCPNPGVRPSPGAAM